MYYVYVLKSLKDNGYYIGSTKDLDRRLKEHNAGMTKPLKHRRPLILVYFEEFKSRSEARKREALLKRFKGGKAFKKLIMCSTGEDKEGGAPRPWRGGRRFKSGHLHREVIHA